MTPEQIQKCNEIIEYYGVNAQLEQLVEECSELILAIQKYKRNGMKNTSDIVEEMGDTAIIIEQLKKGIYCENRIIKSIDYKLNRQLERIKEESKSFNEF